MEKVKKWDEVNGVDNSSKKMEAFLDSANDSYAILQLRDSDETLYERFASMKELGRMGKEPVIDHYEVVYMGDLTDKRDQIDVLEGLFTKFNMMLPQDFQGHSLSVSDIVALKVDNTVSCHYVDSIGFKELPDFIRRNDYLKNAEMAMEDDYGMVGDGIINNGPKEDRAKEEAPVERVSILEQLKKMPSPERTAPPSRNHSGRDER